MLHTTTGTSLFWPAKQHLTIQIQSFGIKSGQPFPLGIDLYLDCRGVIDPSQNGIAGNGDNLEVQAFVKHNSATFAYFDLTLQGIYRLTTRRGEGKEFDKPFQVLTMCAHGIHRSRAMKHILAEWLRDIGFQHVEVK